MTHHLTGHNYSNTKSVIQYMSPYTRTFTYVYIWSPRHPQWGCFFNCAKKICLASLASAAPLLVVISSPSREAMGYTNLEHNPPTHQVSATYFDLCVGYFSVARQLDIDGGVTDAPTYTETQALFYRVCTSYLACCATLTLHHNP